MAISQAINAPAKRALAILTESRLLPPMTGHNTLRFEASILSDEGGNYRIGLRVKPGTALTEVRSILAHMALRGFSFYVGGYTDGIKLVSWTSIYCTRNGFNPWTSKADYATATEVAALTVPSNTDLALHPILGDIQFPEQSVEEEVTTPVAPILDAPAIDAPVVDAPVADPDEDDSWTGNKAVIVCDEPADAEALMVDMLASMPKKQLVDICNKRGYPYRKSYTKAQLRAIISEAELATV